MPTAVSIAQDILSCVPESMLAYKRMIDRGYDLSLGDAMVYEKGFNRVHSSPPPEIVAGRRSGVQSRGREQARQDENGG
jgi:hypothetical protein